MVVQKQGQKQSVHIHINEKRKKKKQKKKTVRREPVPIRPTIGLQNLPQNPFEVSMMNMMASMNQSLSNNFRNDLSMLRTQKDMIMEQIQREQQKRNIIVQNNDPILEQQNKEKMELLWNEYAKMKQLEAELGSSLDDKMKEATEFAKEGSSSAKRPMIQLEKRSTTPSKRPMIQLEKRSTTPPPRTINPPTDISPSQTATEGYYEKYRRIAQSRRKKQSS